MLINLGRKFSKQYDKAGVKIKEAFKSRLKLFKEDSYNPVLNNHQLTGQYLGKQSINITGDWRAIFSETENGKEKVINFELLDTHSNLYK